jgi:hypothetical protein
MYLTIHFALVWCSLLYGAEDPSIAGMVLDSAFSNLYNLMMELVDVYKIRLPKFTVLSLSLFLPLCVCVCLCEDANSLCYKCLIEIDVVYWIKVGLYTVPLNWLWCMCIITLSYSDCKRLFFLPKIAKDLKTIAFYAVYLYL